MATYTELYALSSDAALLERIQTALAITAYSIMAETPTTAYHSERKKWAKSTLSSIEYMAKVMVWVLLSQYSNATAAQIQASTDAQILEAINNVLDSLIEK